MESPSGVIEVRVGVKVKYKEGKSVANIWKIRNRQCNGAKIGSDSCPRGENIETQPCGGFPCARWASWNNWSPCSRTCGVSESVRIRTCIFGSIGDDGCPEKDSKDARECKQETCGKCYLILSGPKWKVFRNKQLAKRFSFKHGRSILKALHFRSPPSIFEMTAHFRIDPLWNVKNRFEHSNGTLELFEF